MPARVLGRPAQSDPRHPLLKALVGELAWLGSEQMVSLAGGLV